MHASLPVIIPLLNPNEPEAQLVAVHVQEGQKVLQDDLICTLETTKSTAEVKAEKVGYIIALRYQEGSIVRAGDTQQLPMQVAAGVQGDAVLAVEGGVFPGLQHVTLYQSYRRGMTSCQCVAGIDQVVVAFIADNSVAALLRQHACEVALAAAPIHHRLA